jgi:hypothetical protein
MVQKDTKPEASERDEPALPLDPEEELRGLNVDPDALVPQDEPNKDQGDPLSDD